MSTYLLIALLTLTSLCAFSQEVTNCEYTKKGYLILHKDGKRMGKVDEVRFLRKKVQQLCEDDGYTVESAKVLARFKTKITYQCQKCQ